MLPSEHGSARSMRRRGDRGKGLAQPSGHSRAGVYAAARENAGKASHFGPNLAGPHRHGPGGRGWLVKNAATFQASPMEMGSAPWSTPRGILACAKALAGRQLCHIATRAPVRPPAPKQITCNQSCDDPRQEEDRAGQPQPHWPHATRRSLIAIGGGRLVFHLRQRTQGIVRGRTDHKCTSADCRGSEAQRRVKPPSPRSTRPEGDRREVVQIAADDLHADRQAGS
jgi:hypothetical protein